MTHPKHILLSLFLLATASSVHGGEPPEMVLKKKFPKMTVDSISLSPVQGVYEVISGSNVFYFDVAGGNLFFGELWSDTGKNLTAEARSKIYAAKYDVFRKRLSEAVRIGSGRHEVIEIVDPDCPYCRQMDSYWKSRADVTRYVFFLPLTSLHPEAMSHVRYILSAPDSVKALDEVAAGKYDQRPVPEIAENTSRVKVHAELTANSGISGTPAYFVNGSFITGANIGAIENIIGRSNK